MIYFSCRFMSCDITVSICVMVRNVSYDYQVIGKMTSQIVLDPDGDLLASAVC